MTTKETGGVKIRKIDNNHYRFLIEAIIVKQKHHKQWIIIVKDNCLAYGTTPVEAIRNLGLKNNIRYSKNLKKNEKSHSKNVDNVV